MILLRDTLRLALTKLRTRKVRLIITVVISGLLFGGMVAGSVVARGMFASLTDFGREGLGGRFIIQAMPFPPTGFYDNAAVLDRALAIHKETVAKKKAEAKKLGIEYDEKLERPPVEEFPTGDGNKQKFLSYGHPAATQATKEYFAAHPGPAQPQAEKLVAPYNSIGVYEHRRFVQGSDGSEVKILKDGQELFGTEVSDKSESALKGGSFVQNWSAMDAELIKPFVLPGQDLTLAADGSIPLVIPYSEAEALLGLKDLPSGATSEDKLARIAEVRTKVTEVRLKVCYRNSSSSGLLGQAVSTQQDIERNKNNKDYQKPELIYGLPTEPCGAVPVTRDVRSKETKELQAKQEAFARTFGAPQPSQQILSFRIVGIAADPVYSGAANVTDIVQSLVTSSLGQDWAAPLDVIKGNELTKQLFSDDLYFTGGQTFFVELATADSARSFIANADCGSFDFADIAKCEEEGKYFMLNPFGSNSLGLDNAQQVFGNIFRIATLVVAGVACLVLSGMVGRMVADSRRETAVFRAMGAKRFDIAQIYIVYILLLGVLIAVFAVALGLGAGLLIDSLFAADITPSILLAYNVQDLTKQFSLFALHWGDFGYIVGLTVAAGLLSALLPLLRNLRRNQIKDVRDDT